VSINLTDVFAVERFLTDTNRDPLPYICGEGDARYVSIGCNLLAKAGYRVRHVQPDVERPRFLTVLFERQ
jgi:hypothetical protein